MTRYLLGFVCVCALGVVPLVGCSETTGDGGSGGTGGSGGSAGSGGMGGSAGSGGTGGTDLCEGVTCEDTECKIDGVCDASDGMCDYTFLDDGTVCGEGVGTCQDGSCAGTFACTEQGILDAIAVGGGPHRFDCDGPTTVVTQAEIEIDNDVVLDGEGNLTVDGDEDHRVFSVPEGVTAELRRLTVTRGAQVQVGGGIFSEGDLVLLNSEVRDSAAAEGGGGIWSGWGGTLTLGDCTVSGNSAEFGGGIRNTGAWAILMNTTVSGNNGRQGGGIHGDAAALTLTNSTVSGNSANTGTAIFYENGGDVTLVSSTVSGSIHASGRTGGTLSFLMAATLVDGMCSQGGDDVEWTSSGYNIESPGDTCRFNPYETDRIDVSAEDLNLGPLQDNGGPTMTHALLPGSIAIDYIPAIDCEVDTDQRAVSRPQGDSCDVGAFELEVAP